jgi:flavin reductase (DIM6/NTAB) family NADH-FMN oxidoreductase RutF
MLTISPKDVPTAVMHSYLLGAIAPRPIAFASTIDAQGRVNLSPFSFFNVFGTKPPTLIFSPNRRVRDGGIKHTLENVLEVPEVTINMVDYSMVEQMSLSSCEYEKGVNEFAKAGFTEIASDLVRPPRVGASKAVMECKVQQVIQMSDEGGSPNLIICEVLRMHISEDILNEKGMIDQRKTDWVARLGGDWYSRACISEALFEVAKPNMLKGIGVDAIPASIRNHPLLDGNDLGKLGNITALPTAEEIAAFRYHTNAPDYMHYAKYLLDNGRVKEAWMAVMSDER